MKRASQHPGCSHRHCRDRAGLGGQSSGSGPGAAVPDSAMTAASNSAPGENLTAGSASLVPLMAADMQANQTTTVDAPATGGGESANRSTTSPSSSRPRKVRARKSSRAQEALPQLQNPELNRIAEMLVNDHSGANARLSKIAEAKHWPLPAPQVQRRRPREPRAVISMRNGPRK